MPLWGRNDQAVTANATTTAESSNGAPIGTHALVRSGGGNSSVRVDSANAHYGNTSAGSRANVDFTMFGNTTMNAFVPGIAVGVFGVDTSEVNVTNGAIALTYVTSSGSGYAANAAVTLNLANGSTNTTAVNSSVTLGRVSALNINVAGSGVRNWQRFLNDHFDGRLEDDGRFGQSTMLVTKNFQKANGITPDGAVGPETMKAALSLLEENMEDSEDLSGME